MLSLSRQKNLAIEAFLAWLVHHGITSLFCATTIDRSYGLLAMSSPSWLTAHLRASTSTLAKQALFVLSNERQIPVFLLPPYHLAKH